MTLIELVVSVSILGVVMGALMSSLFVAMRQNTDTDVRLSESNDVQLAAAPLTADVSGTNTFSTGGSPRCGSTAFASWAGASTVLEMYGATFIPTAIPSSPGAALPVTVVTYVNKPVTAGGKPATELHRFTCSANPQPVPGVDQVIGRLLATTVAGMASRCSADPEPAGVVCAPAVKCLTAAGAVVACSSATAATVKLILAPRSGDQSLKVTLIAHRRTSL